MKKILSKLTVFILAAVALLSVSCDKEGLLTVGDKKFSLTLMEVGPEYAEILVKGPEEMRMAYMVYKREMRLENPQQLFKKGTEVTEKIGEIIRVSLGLAENTKYYMYACAAQNKKEFSKIVTLPFETTQYNLTELATVIDQ